MEPNAGMFEFLTKYQGRATCAPLMTTKYATVTVIAS
jgi:hypothetical protein